MERQRTRTSASRLLLGITMLGVGAVLLLDRMHLATIGPLWRLWPVPLIGIGLSKVLRPEEIQCSQSGLMMIFIGALYLLVNFGFFGLTFGNSWPLILVALGLIMVVQSLFQMRPVAEAPGKVSHDE